MRKLSKFLIITILCFLTFMPVSVWASAPVFTDISGHWAESVIEKFFYEDIISGFPDGSFRPDQDVTRAQLARIITLAFDLNEENQFNYLDADPEAWYYGYLKFTTGFIPAYQFRGFFVGSHAAHRIDVTETLVLIKMHMEDLEIDIPPLEDVYRYIRSTFKDSDFYFGDIRIQNVQRLFYYTWLGVHMGIIEGDPYGYFRPAWGITRAELLTMIYRIRG